MLHFDKTCTEIVSCDTTAVGEINIPDFITKINKNAFRGCNRITRVCMGNQVTHIGANAFADCDNLKYVRLSDNIQIIEFGTFSYCRDLTTINLPLRLIYINDRAFNMCTSLSNIEFPSKLKSIGYESFIGANFSTLKFPLGLETICEAAFCNNHELVSVELPNSIISIGNNAFRGCEKLNNIEIPNGIKLLGNYCFSGCNSITEVIIPSSVESIGYGAFIGTQVSQYIVSKNNSFYLGIDGVIYTKDMHKLIAYPMYKKGTIFEVPINTVEFEKCAFCGSKYLQEIKFHKDFKIIGESCFSTSSIRHIIIPELVRNIPDYTFRQSHLESVAFNNNIENIGDFAFCECKSLKYVELPDSVVEIGKSAFCFCSNLISAKIPKNVTTIGAGAFGWSYIKEIHIAIEDLSVVKEEFTDNIHYDECTLFIPYGTKYAYTNHMFFRKFSNIICEDT